PPAGVPLAAGGVESQRCAGKAGEREGMKAWFPACRGGLAGPTSALSQVRPAVVLLAHTASSYALGYGNEQPLVDRIASLAGAPALLAAQAVLAALRHLGVKRLALGTPYPESISRQGKAYWEAAGFEIAGYHRLEDVTDIYAENEERAYELAPPADAPQAAAGLLSGTGLPTVAVVETLERDLGKPVLSSNQASLWQALRMARVRESIAGYGRLLREI